MKKAIIAIALIAGTISFTNAQELGVRFGNISAGNVAIDGVFSTGEFNRIHSGILSIARLVMKPLTGMQELEYSPLLVTILILE